MTILEGILEIQREYPMQDTECYGECFQRMYEKYDENWKKSVRSIKGIPPSRENWRLEKQLNIVAGNPSPEKQIEKQIVRDPELNNIWYNQVPTASGLCTQSSDKKRSVDLVRFSGCKSYQLIELKYESNSPYTAAREQMQYAILYAFSRRRYPEELVRGKPLLNADSVQHCVLAPRVFYTSVDRCKRLQAAINKGLSVFSETNKLNYTSDFAFLTFPAEFEFPFTAGQLRAAVKGISPLC